LTTFIVTVRALIEDELATESVSWPPSLLSVLLDGVTVTPLDRFTGIVVVVVGGGIVVVVVGGGIVVVVVGGGIVVVVVGGGIVVVVAGESLALPHEFVAS
jgi:hypothetical protein